MKPFCAERVMVLLPTAPCMTARLFGEEERENVGAAVTLTMTEVVAVSEPEVPVTVTLTANVVTGALAAAVNVIVLVPLLTGLKDALTPLGKPEVVNETEPLKPFSAAMLMEVAAVVP